MRTFVLRGGEIDRAWWLVDAEGMILGRLATVVASTLRGKHKPSYTPFLDVGDHVVVVNAEKIVLTGNKLDQKVYRRHSGYPGGLREIPVRRMLAEHPTRVVESAVRGMLPKTKLGRGMYRKLRVYAGPEHPHTAQQPRPLAISAGAQA